MQKNYLLVGASSYTALALAKILKKDNQNVIGISRQNEISDFDTFFTLENYNLENLPTLDFPIDGLVYFPGTIQLKPFHRITQQDFLNDFQINVLGATMVFQKYLNNLKQADKPSVVMISSVAATSGMPFHSSIGMAKAALEGLCKALAAEYAPKIRFNTIAPSLTNTPLAQKFLSSEEKIELAANRNPLKKVGTPEDLAYTIDFLLSDKSNWITAQTISVDGGLGILKL